MIFFFISRSFLIFSLVAFSWGGGWRNLLKYYYSIYPLFLEWDLLGKIFLYLVFWITTIMLIFRNYYVSGPKRTFFTLTLISFIGAISLLITFPSPPTLIIGWDLLGITSFLLVIFYSSKIRAFRGIVTVLFNRLGDAFFIVLLICFIRSIGALLTVLGAFIIIGIFTKSAQFPISLWLPLAIMAPTPVSALVHSSTLVTAGVYVFIRYNWILQKVPLILILVFIGGNITCNLGGLIALFSKDIKKTVAFSTLSQMGFLVITATIGNLFLAFFHLLTHAVFKSFLFMVSGTFIHSLLGSQDIRKPQKGSSRLMIMSVIYLSLIRIIGFPFLCGFYSKDLFLELKGWNNLSRILIILGRLAASVTSAYRFRILRLIGGSTNQKKSTIGKRDHILDWRIFFSTALRVIALILSGTFQLWVFFSLFPLSQKLETFLLVALGAILGATIRLLKLSYFDQKIFRLEVLSVTPYLGGRIKIIESTYSFFDKGWIEIPPHSIKKTLTGVLEVARSIKKETILLGLFLGVRALTTRIINFI